MNIFKLSLANLRFKPLNNLFNVIILALGIAAISTTFQVSNQIESKFSRSLQGIDLVVGAKGSPLQLILSTVFHLDVPTGNIPFNEAQNLRENSLIKSSIPLALGDNYNGFRIVGTNSDYINHYGGKLEQGAFADDEMQVIIGSEVAQNNNLKLGDKIVSAHGLGNQQADDDVHEDSPYTVVGILQKNNSVLDRLIITPIASIWHVHHHHHEEEEVDPEKHHEDKAKEDEEAEREITALLITYESPIAALSLPRQINQSTNLQAAVPAFEIARLIKIFGIGSETIKLFSFALILISVIGLFITTLNSVNERTYDIALMRSLGASRQKIVKILLSESLILGIIASVLGLFLGHVFLYSMALWLNETKHLSLDISCNINQFYIAASSILLTLLATIIPALLAYKINISKALARQ